ncbi:hypothetical protein AG1IA_08349 [Rhizoctonia solani AG-1 IA]|uniref:Costars domain-containing protein n=1 Tax=Thanatephorus cucumeris (strain AG1-IA) TaxID=983506 RepID=L8WI67_THACA|nr:hypothetical protein AG1IA_08349 [Rhizoctonia solani AG-1 IA]
MVNVLPWFEDIRTSCLRLIRVVNVSSFSSLHLCDLAPSSRSSSKVFIRLALYLMTFFAYAGTCYSEEHTPYAPYSTVYYLDSSGVHVGGFSDAFNDRIMLWLWLSSNRPNINVDVNTPDGDRDDGPNSLGPRLRLRAILLGFQSESQPISTYYLFLVTKVFGRLGFHQLEMDVLVAVAGAYIRHVPENMLTKLERVLSDYNHDTKRHQTCLVLTKKSSPSREIKRLGTKPADGQPGIAVVKFGKLVRDEKAIEALNGTLRAAKRKGVVTFEGQMLLQGAHDNIDVILLQDE